MNKEHPLCRCEVLFSSVQFSHSLMSGSLWPPWTTACQASLFITNSRSLPKLMSIESVMPSNHLIFCCPLLLLPSIFPSMRVFSNESLLHISGQSTGVSVISPSNEYSGLISFRIDWFDLLAVQCPPADEWIRNLWYIYTMEYYSAIKKNTFELVLMRWMKLEPIIQSEVSQKEKHANTYIWKTY